MKIKDMQSGYTFEYGGCHDSLRISGDGRSLSYYNLQNGDGSRFGDYRFVMDDGEVPQESESVCAYYGDCYFNIGGFPSVEQIRADVIDEAIHRLDNSKANCHEDYIDGIDFAIGVLQSIAEQLKEQNIE